MTWHLEGLEIAGTYLDTFPVRGRVELSRVAYGGSVKHTVVLSEPIRVYGAVRERVILDHREIHRVADRPVLDN
jgi:hypothetical protein